MTGLTNVKKLKPWMTNRVDLELEMKELGLRRKDLKLDRGEHPVVLDVINSDVDRVKYQISTD